MAPIISLSLILPCQQLKKPKQAIDDCSSAIKLDDTYIKAYLRRATVVSQHKYVFQILCSVVQVCAVFEWLSVTCSYTDTELYDEAVRDYEKVYQTEKTAGTPLIQLSHFYVAGHMYTYLHGLLCLLLP